MIKQIPKEVNEHNVLICPAMTPSVEGKRIYFLFSLYQIEDIQGKLKVTDVPFSAPFVEGMTIWRNSVIPVISLERYLGMSTERSTRGHRYIIIRSTRRRHESSVEMRGAIKTDREVKMMPIPNSSAVAQLNGWINPRLVKGIFECDEGFIVVPETDKMIHGDIQYSNSLSGLQQ